jgi:DNA-binding NarL/FixJ family response regulator
MHHPMRDSGSRDSHKHSEPAPGSPTKPFIVVSEPRGLGGTPLASQLDPNTYEIAWCNEEEGVLDQVIQRRPHALVFALGESCQSDLALLFLLRRVAPGVPLILVAPTASLETQKLIQDLRPTYYVVRPVDQTELDEAVAAAIARQARRPAR